MIHYIISATRESRNAGFHMYPIFIVIVVSCIIQFTKIAIDSIRLRRFYRGHIFSSGGFPSFHSWLASSATMMVWLHYGFASVHFAVVCAFSVLFAYDAMNLRFEAGQHALYINNLRTELQWVLQKKEWPLKERIWHTPFEVLWWIVFGSVLTFVLYYWYFIA